MDYKDVSPLVISRLPRYFRYLGELREAGVERISSRDLSAIMKVTASQIRQDFNHFGGFGQQGYGYNVVHLHEQIGLIMGLDRTHKIVIVGAGHIGQALVSHNGFAVGSFEIVGIFDNDPSVIGKELADIEVMDIRNAPEFIKRQGVDMAVITVPRSAAVSVAELLVNAGISAILNFAHIDLSVPEHVQVENVHLTDQLLKLSYRIRDYKND